MRHALALTVLLAGCPAEDPADGVGADTDRAGDSEPVETAPTLEDDCLVPLDPPALPVTWADVTARGELSCYATSLCDPGSGRAVARAWEGECEGSRVGFYDAGGALFAEHVADDVARCGDDRYDYWRGEVVPACSDWAPWTGRRSPGCATPSAHTLPRPAEGCVVDAPPSRATVGVASGGLAAFVETNCVGVATCVLGERTLDLLYVDDLECDEVGALDAWDRATGALVATYEPSAHFEACGFAAHWVGLDLSPCFPVTFTPSAACGVPALP